MTTGRAEQAPVAAASESEPLTQFSRSFKQAIASMRRLRSREVRGPGELSDAQYGLLFGLREHAQLSSRELAATADVSPAAATEMLDGLEAAALVRRVRSERDRRVVLVSLTDHGRALVEERRARLEPRWRAAFSGFSDDELIAAAVVLDRLRDLFDQMADEGLLAGLDAHRDPAVE